MLLGDIHLKRIYRSEFDNFTRDLIIPALQNSITYDRGTGYFSLSSLASLAEGLVPFIKNGGNIRIVTSVDLDLPNRVIIQKGVALQKVITDEKLKRDIEAAIENSTDEIKLDLITNLIAANRMIIKVAYMPLGGLYHEKIGIFNDGKGNRVLFLGSSNETYSGNNTNLESFVTFSTWRSDEDVIDIREQEAYFERLWNNSVKGLEVYSFPDAVKFKLFKRFKKSDNIDEAINRFEKTLLEDYLTAQKAKTLYPFQEKAIDQFRNNRYCHFYEMATGTGKTFTAIKTIEQLYREKGKLSVMVIVPQIDLQSQWQSELLAQGIACYLFGGLADTTITALNIDRFTIDSCSALKLVVGLSTYDTFFGKVTDKIRSLTKEMMIIVDEAHNLSPNQIMNLPETFPFRLGLSATPERFSKAETLKIIEYFTRGKIETYKYSIEDAINSGYLSHYNYYPLIASLGSDEFLSYQNYTKQLSILEGEDPRDEEKIIDIRTRRSIVIKKAKCKVEKLYDMVKSRKYNFHNAVVYCGQGKDYSTEELIIDSVTRILAVEGSFSVSHFTSKTVDRVKVLSEFERGYFDVLVAIKCFDEGVDVPKLDKIYIMASDALRRQTIQRRGRVLRKCYETGKEIAEIYDFIVTPPPDEFGGTSKSLLTNELRRAKEYARLADNFDLVTMELSAICKYYGLDWEDIDEGREGEFTEGLGELSVHEN